MSELVLLPPRYELYLRFARLARAIYATTPTSSSLSGWTRLGRRDGCGSQSGEAVADEIHAG
jgi:hypothetical protein